MRARSAARAARASSLTPGPAAPRVRGARTAASRTAPRPPGASASGAGWPRTGSRTRAWRAARPGSSGSPHRTTGTGSATGRARSRRAGRTLPGSRLAAANWRASSWPRGIVTPPTSTSSSTQRSNIGAGVSKRSSSSIAVGTSPGSARSRARASGWRNSAHQELAAPLTDASCPALRSRTAVPISSSSVSRSPSVSRTAPSWLIRSVAGRRPTLPRDAAQVCLELDARRRRPTLGLGAGVELEHQGHVGRPWPEQVTILLRDPEQLGDHGDRHQLERGRRSGRTRRARALRRSPRRRSPRSAAGATRPSAA